MSKHPKNKRSPSPSDPKGLDAGEYALGLGDREEISSANNRIKNDPEYRVEVAEWGNRLSNLSQEVELVDAPAGIWEKIEDRVTGAASGENAGATGFWNNLAFWRGLSVISIATVIALLFVVPPSFFKPGSVNSDMRFSANLSSADARPSFSVQLDSGVIEVRSQNFQANETRVPELWLVASDGVPRSLGLLKPNIATSLEIGNANIPLMKDGAVLAVSLEPEGGAPQGKPTGPIIASGPLNSG